MHYNLHKELPCWIPHIELHTFIRLEHHKVLDFVVEIREKGTIGQDSIPHIFIVLMVTGDWRLIFDLSVQNHYFAVTSFLDGGVVIFEFVTKTEWMVSLDQKGAYCQVPILLWPYKHLWLVWQSKICQF